MNTRSYQPSKTPVPHISVLRFQVLVGSRPTAADWVTVGLWVSRAASVFVHSFRSVGKATGHKAGCYCARMTTERETVFPVIAGGRGRFPQCLWTNRGPLYRMCVAVCVGWGAIALFVCQVNISNSRSQQVFMMEHLTVCSDLEALVTLNKPFAPSLHTPLKVKSKD